MLGFGLTVAAIGMGVVFFELILLIFVIKLLTLVARAINQRAGDLSKKKSEVAVPETPVIASIQDEDNDIVAVIAATVAYMAQGPFGITTGKHQKPFSVRQ